MSGLSVQFDKLTQMEKEKQMFIEIQKFWGGG
jgi:hypothetical protein